jgi:hypothetical protein
MHMTIVNLVQLIRDRVHHVFLEQGIPHDAEIRETILVRDGCYCGRRFECDGGHALWFCEENQLKFYGSDGRLNLVLRNLDTLPANSPATIAFPARREAA